MPTVVVTLTAPPHVLSERTRRIAELLAAALSFEMTDDGVTATVSGRISAICVTDDNWYPAWRNVTTIGDQVFTSETMYAGEPIDIDQNATAEEVAASILETLKQRKDPQ